MVVNPVDEIVVVGGVVGGYTFAQLPVVVDPVDEIVVVGGVVVIHFLVTVVVNPVDEIVVVGGVVVIHLFSYLW